MTDFEIFSGGSTTYTDTTPNGGVVIDFAVLDNSFSVQVNGVDLFVGGPTGAENELQFQTPGTSGQTVRFADGDIYGTDTPQIWQLENSDGSPVVKIEINPDGTIALYGVKADDGTLVPLELVNGLSVNTAAIAAAWDDTGSNTIVIDQIVTGPTVAAGEIIDVPCFASGTLIETAQGHVRVENLSTGDKVLTHDQGYHPIRWIGSCYVSGVQLADQPRLRPILIRADALGAGYPKHDLIVSPQHRVLVSSAIAMRMFGRKEVLVPAKKLLPLDGITALDDMPNGVTYWHVLFDDHQVIWSNGAPTESLFTGPEALKALSHHARQEIETLFPEICKPDFEPVSAHYIPLTGKRVKKLVTRHQMNNKPLYDVTHQG
ncbi:Hint domain-containing protein [Yoonia sp. BS5-3]|uniref:Hint domain-containing protein n=1 Tax=Yoonia phaeophyticola TaxID=3137369 RepID=A0ABZ2V464_9RHOB